MGGMSSPYDQLLAWDSQLQQGQQQMLPQGFLDEEARAAIARAQQDWDRLREKAIEHERLAREQMERDRIENDYRGEFDDAGAWWRRKWISGAA